jgi:16S rRNA (uracil1498-N3)-methyltransferase
MDFLVEKCTELGVREFIPMKTERTIVSKVHTERLQKLALSAMTQCGRSFLPQIRDLTNFQEVLNSLQNCQKKFIMHERIDMRAKPWGKIEAEDSLKSVGILIGPEGGFTEEEVKAAESAGFVCVSLGTRRLRSETAAIASVSAITLSR